jgi:hypothetical protein
VIHRTYFVELNAYKAEERVDLAKATQISTGFIICTITCASEEELGELFGKRIYEEVGKFKSNICKEIPQLNPASLFIKDYKITKL